MSEIDFELIGRQAVANVIAGDAGFDSSFLINAVSEGAKRGVGEYQNRQAADKAKQDSAEALRRATAADEAWSDAEVMLELAAPNQKVAATAIRDTARSNALAIHLSGDSQQKRVESAQMKSSAAADASYKAPNDKLASARLHSWQKVAAAVAANAASPDSGGGSPALSNKPAIMERMGFLTKKVGPLPVWGWGLTIIGGGTALALIVKALKK